MASTPGRGRTNQHVQEAYENRSKQYGIVAVAIALVLLGVPAGIIFTHGGIHGITNTHVNGGALLETHSGDQNVELPSTGNQPSQGVHLSQDQLRMIGEHVAMQAKAGQGQSPPSTELISAIVSEVLKQTEQSAAGSSENKSPSEAVAPPVCPSPPPPAECPPTKAPVDANTAEKLAELARLQKEKEEQDLWAPLLPESAEVGPRPVRDPFWRRVGFILRTGDNVAPKRLPPHMLSWLGRLPRRNIVGVSDKATEEGVTVLWRGHNFTLPKLHDGVTEFAVPTDKESGPDAPAWDRDFIKHLGAFHVARKEMPWVDWYVMADDDTYFFLPQLKLFLQSKEMRSRKSDFSEKELKELRSEFEARLEKSRNEKRGGGSDEIVDISEHPKVHPLKMDPEPDFGRVADLPEARAKAKADGKDPESITSKTVAVAPRDDYPWANPAAFGMVYGLAGGIELAEKCQNYQRHDESYYIGAGAGVMMTRAGVDLLVREIPYCSHRTANCWAGDRRLGSCLIDAGVKFLRGKIGGDWFYSRDVEQKYDEWHKPSTQRIATLHHIKGPEGVVLPALETMFGADGMTTNELSIWMDVISEARSEADGPEPLKRNRWKND